VFNLNGRRKSRSWFSASPGGKAVPATRRRFLQSIAATAAVAAQARPAAAKGDRRPTIEQLNRVAAQRVLRLDGLKSPVKIASLELLRNGRTFLVRVRSQDGAEGLIVPNSDRLRDVYPVFLNRVAPFFLGKDARDLETLLEELYRHDSNYKFQGLALWVCVAAAEFALLDMLGKIAAKSLGDLLGGVRRRDIAIYRASGNRGNTPAQEIAYLKKIIAESGARALKFRLGGRMSNNADSLPGRTEKLIPLVRETFGDGMILYADANSSYDVPRAIEIGRLLEKFKYGFYEEPVRFDHLDEMKQVKDALTIPVAAGEQEFSMWGFRWTIQHRVVDIVQPDLHYFGGFVRCMRVARMAAAADIACTLHMGGTGLGYLDALHFMACIPNAYPYQEYKGPSGIPVMCATSSLQPKDGIVRVPSGPGFGYTIDPDFVRKAVAVRTA
jgi:L-alanine-DL-glutamate epimerase-like enolase superfamily enzyme